MTTVATDITRPGDLRNDLAPKSNFPTPFGLFSVAQTPPPGSDQSWVSGIEFEHASCDPVSGISGICIEGKVGYPKNLDGNSGVVAEATAFTLYGSYNCGPIGSPSTRAAEFARLNLLRHEQEGVEDAISAGTFQTIPTLEDASTTVLNPTAGTPVSPAFALGLLAAHAGSTFGTVGTIHAPRVAYAALAANGLIEVVGSGDLAHLQTKSGDLVSIGAGYANTSPDGTEADAGTAWLYVTPPVIVLRSDFLDTPPTQTGSNQWSLLDRINNDFYALSERHYLVAWDDCPLAAVLVDISGGTVIDGGTP